MSQIDFQVHSQFNPEVGKEAEDCIHQNRKYLENFKCEKEQMNLIILKRGLNRVYISMTTPCIHGEVKWQLTIPVALDTL